MKWMFTQKSWKTQNSELEYGKVMKMLGTVILGKIICKMLAHAAAALMQYLNFCM